MQGCTQLLMHVRTHLYQHGMLQTAHIMCMMAGHFHSSHQHGQCVDDSESSASLTGVPNGANPCSTPCPDSAPYTYAVIYASPVALLS